MFVHPWDGVREVRAKMAPTEQQAGTAFCNRRYEGEEGTVIIGSLGVGLTLRGCLDNFVFTTATKPDHNESLIAVAFLGSNGVRIDTNALHAP